MRVRLTVPQHIAASYMLLIALVSTVATLLAAQPISGRLAFFHELGELRTIHARASATLAENRAILETQTSPEHAAVEDALFLAGDTAPLAAAELQNRIRRIVEGEGGVLVSSAFRSRVEPLPLTPVSVVVRLRCSIESLTGILHGLEALDAALFLENLSIQSNHRAGRALREPSDELDVEFEITGYLNRPSQP